MWSVDVPGDQVQRVFVPCWELVGFALLNQEPAALAVEVGVRDGRRLPVILVALIEGSHVHQAPTSVLVMSVASRLAVAVYERVGAGNKMK